MQQILLDSSQQPNDRSEAEAKLWKAFKSGDQASFALIYQKFFPYLYSCGHKVGADTNLINDAIQDLFVYLWKHRATLADTSSIKYYLRTSLLRKIRRMTAESSTATIEVTDITAFESSPEATIIAEEVSEERKAHVLAAMQALTKRQRQAVQLKFYHNLKNEEIAQRMAIKVEAVYNLISKSLVVLKRSYQNVSILTLLTLFFPF
ncbi:MAG: sigma-70 family RNA polymerase sigma factor [Tunicatimonas sp.]